MRLFEEKRAATLADVSWLRRALRRQLVSLRIRDELVNDIQLAIAELATNAVKHASPSPTEIGLTVDLVGAQLRIELVDDGAPFVGFADAWAAAAKKEVAATQPSGLGLALARGLLRGVSYTPGPPNRLVGMRPLAYRRPAILLVEDENTIRRVYGLMLADRYRVYAAESVDAALAIAAVRHLDLVVTDFHIGTDPATRLLAELERDAQRMPLPVIVISADPADATRARAEGFGIEQFLAKPVTASQLQNAVERALAASHRRLTGMLRHFGASVDGLLAPPTAADLASIGIASCSGTATVGSGDFVIHLKADGRDRIVIADVMGHGLQAAAGAISFSTTLRALDAALPAAVNSGPGSFLSAVSSAMQADESLASMIVTVLVVDRLSDGSLRLASAGHPPPVLVSASKVAPVEVGGPLLGLSRMGSYETVEVQPRRGERLVVTTDGIDPVLVASGGSLPAALLDALRCTSEQPLSNAIGAARAWADAALGPSPRDDWTIMLLEAVGNAS